MLGALVLLTIVLIVFGYYMNDKAYEKDEMAKDRTLIAETIKPVAAVNTGEAIIAEIATEEVALAFDGSTDGNMIYENVCSACHTTGAGGAPKLEAPAWAGRLDKGLDALVANAVNGYQGEAGYMPAKGGRTDLSEEQVKATVEFMIEGL